MPSDFMSSTPGSAVWSSASQSCSSTGRAVLADMRAGLIWESLASMSAEDAGVAINDVQNGSDQGWTPAVLTQLANLLAQYGWNAAAQQVRLDASLPVGSPLSITTLKSALWAANSRTFRTVTSDGRELTVNRHNGSPNDYIIPTDARMPRLGMVPPMPLDGIISGMSCRTIRAPTGTNTPVTAVGERTIDPMLLLLLLGGTVLAGVVLLNSAQKSQGSHW